ncbi:hypothetical protein CH253_13025 [Rhodococcus sp. 06-156-3C]|nr:hypothetical protein CH280_22385 [Rhodococcus sp. 06-156-4C]OZD21857.1 hypothetical protein CH253_13025 [Rhodococcus sp. 06-156-3C]OZD24112.1 hypothetical protein CH248_06005 [Rhodococcus sp. 06-156-4a]OZD29415.1 hypothetical protein CH247_18140 [Rhodococcus sp. 06-156-3b]OZD29619.1 hypothetical protein CH284_25950 [Rhodococcus sp. 06-156-3]OZF59875.1 hypothetical protein CH290_18890 [Rhodococcus sp. 06-156-4]
MGQVSLLYVFARPTWDTVLIAWTDSSTVKVAVLVLVATVSRVALDLSVFFFARVFALGVAPVVGCRVEALRRRLDSRWLLAISAVYSATPVMAAIGLSRTSALLVSTVNVTGNLAVMTGYITAAKYFKHYLDPVRQQLQESGPIVYLALALLVTVLILSTARRFVRYSQAETRRKRT